MAGSTGRQEAAMAENGRTKTMQARKVAGMWGASGLMVGALVAIASPEVQAYYASLPASTCMAEWLDYAHVYQSAGDPQMVLKSDFSNGYVCPVVDNSNIQHQNLNLIRVWVDKSLATTDPYARACVWLPSSGSGGICGNPYSGTQNLFPELSQLTDPAHSLYTAYLYVYLPDNSYLYDVYFEDT
jgi:hypothetical protein